VVIGPGKKICNVGKHWNAKVKEEPTETHLGNTLLATGLPRSPTCPDGIGWEGVFFQHFQNGGTCLTWMENQRLACEQHECIGGRRVPFGVLQGSRKKKTGYSKYSMRCKGGISPFKGMCTKQHCDKTNPQVCLKMKVVHVEMMSPMSGLLLFKRSSCFKGKCSVFKTGLCIDIGQNVWGSAFNFNHEQVHSISDMKGGYLAKQKLFGYWASMLLKKYKNKLPKQHQCADGRRKFWVQLQCRDRLPFCAKFLKHCPNADRVRLTLPGKEVKLAQYCAKTCKKCQDPNTVGKHKWALLTNGDVGCDAKNGCTHQDATLARLATVNF